MWGLDNYYQCSSDTCISCAHEKERATQSITHLEIQVHY